MSKMTYKRFERNYKYRVIEWYITQRNRHGIGQSFFGFFAGLIGFVAIAQIYIKYIFNYTPSILVCVVAGIVLVFLYWLWGYIWDKKNCIIIEAEWANKRDALKIEMRKKFHLPDPKGKV